MRKRIFAIILLALWGVASLLALTSCGKDQGLDGVRLESYVNYLDYDEDLDRSYVTVALSAYNTNEERSVFAFRYRVVFLGSGGEELERRELSYSGEITPGNSAYLSLDFGSHAVGEMATVQGEVVSVRISPVSMELEDEDEGWNFWHWLGLAGAIFMGFGVLGGIIMLVDEGDDDGWVAIGVCGVICAVLVILIIVL